MKDGISFFLLVQGQGRLAWHQGHSCTSPTLCNEGFGTLDILAECFMGTIAGRVKEQFITAEALLIAQCPQCIHKDGWIIKGSKKSLLEVSLLHTGIQQEVHSGGLCVTHSRDCWHNGFWFCCLFSIICFMLILSMHLKRLYIFPMA